MTASGRLRHGALRTRWAVLPDKRSTSLPGILVSDTDRAQIDHRGRLWRLPRDHRRDPSRRSRSYTVRAGACRRLAAAGALGAHLPNAESTDLHSTRAGGIEG